MLKKIIYTILFAVLCGPCLAQVNPSKKAVQPQASTKPETKPYKPTGPTGLGLLKIGMTKTQVEALQASDGIYLTNAMTPYVNERYTPVDGVDKFNTYLQTPLSTTAFKSVLTFEAGKLSSIYINFDDANNVLEQVTSQISEKYGAGVINSDRKEEQCIYKNGANFKITKGTITTMWTESLSQNERIETITNDWLFDMCPSNLRYGSVGASKMTSITIQKRTVSPADKSKNIF